MQTGFVAWLAELDGNGGPQQGQQDMSDIRHSCPLGEPLPMPSHGQPCTKPAMADAVTCSAASLGFVHKGYRVSIGHSRDITSFAEFQSGRTAATCLLEVSADAALCMQDPLTALPRGSCMSVTAGKRICGQVNGTQPQIQEKHHVEHISFVPYSQCSPAIPCSQTPHVQHTRELPVPSRNVSGVNSPWSVGLQGL